ncbi:hypothetical protein HZR23_03040 [Serpentinicella alkaliphila]|uniref:YcdB/YcdC repeated domain-containing protein n=2 Tax=Serpentinicella alkaliphila TaxID=1734049 RepID=A0A4V2T408_9FIRM|nr:YcdB/YcdC domain-containing protein [Serpentinicella alkaliphila]QUH24864.1 hypothetical protein HZR23_03040 [Serpentinicella alkaliphila]TCQ03424.1 hypothetical protein EDD79_10093 [Serpentinicella alkaliphila]
MWQIANNFEEMSRLYRHSSIPNKHPEYISFEKAVNSIGEQLTELKDYDIKVDSKNVFVKEGVHYYQFNLGKENELVYTVAIDARSGAIRNLEYKKAIDGNKLLSSYETLNIATNFLKKYYTGDFQTEMLYIKNDNDNTSLYSFRFIPIEDNIKILSDAYIVNVCPQSGRILKYSNDYNNTKVVSTEQYFSQQEILTKNPSDLGVLTYEGLTLVRSFRTRFRPTLTHSFRTTQKDQQLILYYDVRTGVLVHQLYHLYEQMQL